MTSFQEPEGVFTKLRAGFGLKVCKDAKALHFIKLLGLKNKGSGKGRPSFVNQQVIDFYNRIGVIAKALSQRKSRSQLLNYYSEPDFLVAEVQQLLEEFGPTIWPSEDDQRKHLIRADQFNDKWYPKDLYFHREDDCASIKLYTRCSIAVRALGQAMTKNTPHRESSPSPSTAEDVNTLVHGSCSNESISQYRAPLAPMDLTTRVAPGSAKKMPVRILRDRQRRASYDDGEDSESDLDEDTETEEETESVSSMRTDDTDSSSSAPTVAEEAAHLGQKRKARHDKYDDIGFMEKPTKIVKLRLDPTKLRFFNFSTTDPSLRPQPLLQTSNEDGHVQRGLQSPISPPDTARPDSNCEKENSPRLVHSEPISLQAHGDEPNLISGRETHHMIPEDNVRGSLSPTTIRKESVDSSFQPVQPSSETTESQPVLADAKVKLLRKQILDRFLAALKSDRPSDLVTRKLEPLITEDVWTKGVYDSIEDPTSVLPRLLKSFQLWIEMHRRFDSFRTVTKYTGCAGEDWDQFWRGLSSWNSRALAWTSFNNLGLWADQKKVAGVWCDGMLFDRDLAIFFHGISQASFLSPDDLVEGFSTYNEKLLAWFA